MKHRGSRGGGVQIYASAKIVTKQLKNIEPNDSEILCLDIQLPDFPDKHILLSQCYRPDDRNIVDFVSDLYDIYEYSSKNNYFMNIFLVISMERIVIGTLMT